LAISAAKEYHYNSEISRIFGAVPLYDMTTATPIPHRQLIDRRLDARRLDFAQRNCLFFVHPMLKNYSADYEQLHRKTENAPMLVIDGGVPA
jgi:hypothetical protein